MFNKQWSQKIMFLLCLLVVGLTVSAQNNVAASGGDPGSAADPVVSKSYVDQRISEVMALVSAGASGGGTAVSTGAAVFTPVQVLAGQQLIGGEGAEIILRSGSGTAIAPGDGIVDTTSGQDLKNGVAIPSNHLLIIPRSDGRGIAVSTNAWFMVKGSYSIVPAS